MSGISRTWDYDDFKKSLLGEDNAFDSDVLDEQVRREAGVTTIDDDIDELTSALAQTCILLDLEPKDIKEDNLLVKVIEMTHRIMNIDSRRATRDELEEKLRRVKELREEKALEWEERSKIMRQEDKVDADAKKKHAFYRAKFNDYYEKVKEKEEAMKNFGFTADLSEESFNQLRSSIASRTDSVSHMKVIIHLCLCNIVVFFVITFHESHPLQKELKKFKDFEPTEASLLAKMQEIKKEIQDYDSYMCRESM